MAATQHEVAAVRRILYAGFVFFVDAPETTGLTKVIPTEEYYGNTDDYDRETWRE